MNAIPFAKYVEQTLENWQEQLDDLKSRIQAHETEKTNQHTAEIEAMAQEYEVIKAQYRQLRDATAEKKDTLKTDIKSKMSTFQTNIEKAFQRIK